MRPRQPSTRVPAERHSNQKETAIMAGDGRIAALAFRADGVAGAVGCRSIQQAFWEPAAWCPISGKLLRMGVEVLHPSVTPLATDETRLRQGAAYWLI